MMAEHGSALRRTLAETVLYPPHPPRHASSRYLRSHHHLVVELNRPCLVCGVTDRDLQDAGRRDDPSVNPYGARSMETHHHLIEDSLANAVDLVTFNGKVRPGLLKRTGDVGAYGHDFARDEMLDWIHGSIDALWVLCDVHHRHPLVGCHAITGPVWGCQDLLIPGYDLTGYRANSPVEAQQLTALPQTTGTAQPPAAAQPASTTPQG